MYYLANKTAFHFTAFYNPEVIITFARYSKNRTKECLNHQNTMPGK
jgi:hypothetical protein